MLKDFFNPQTVAIIGASRDALKLISFGHITNVTKSNFMFYYIVFAVIPFNLIA